MNNYRVLIAYAAEKDLQGIFEYISIDLQSIKAARNILKKLETQINNLEIFPEKYKKYPVEPWCSRNVRVMTVNSYCVFYIPNDAKMTVTIIRVIYGARDLDRQLNIFEKQ